MSADSIARLKVTLDNVRPQPVRRLEVPLTIRLDRLHDALQAAMGWDNDHLWEFRLRDVAYGPAPDLGSEFGGTLSAERTTLLRALEHTGSASFKYLYDFGDIWVHTVRIEATLEPADTVTYPLLVEAAGACPPEDIGGPGGYARMLAALADPKHPRHLELREWHGDFNADDANIDGIKQRLAALAEYWAPKPPPERKPRAPRKRKAAEA